MRLAIADPPYPPIYSERHDTADGVPRLTTHSRAVRWYGDRHPEAHVFDTQDAHRALLERLVEEFDGWAIATTPDGLGAYHPLPVSARIMSWHRTNGLPGAHRILSRWEPVIVFPPRTRRARSTGPYVPDVLVCGAPRGGFPGAKPAAWTRWILDALGYDHETDELVDLFPGSGAVTNEAEQTAIPFP